MEEQQLLARNEDGVLILTLNRPSRLNAFTQKMLRLLNEQLRTATMDPSVFVILLTGAGRAFCAGGDIRDSVTPDDGDPLATKWFSDPAWTLPEQNASRLSRHHEIPLLLHSLPKPTVAAVRGPAYGAGLCLAAACDFRIASDTATFSTAFAKAALSGDFGGSYLLTRLLGTAMAKELYFLSERVEASRAIEIGLVNRTVPDAELDKEALAFARRLADGPRVAFHYMKRNLNAAISAPLERVLEMEAVHMSRVRETQDAREAAKAFAEKRKPTFKGS